jgi:hypothetical protein
MNTDNEKLYEALDNIAYVNSFMMLPENKEDEMPFLLSQLCRQLKKPDNKERVEFYRLVK